MHGMLDQKHWAPVPFNDLTRSSKRAEDVLIEKDLDSVNSE